MILILLLNKGQKITYNYTGYREEILIPPGNYGITCFGAEGGGKQGDFTYGEFYITKHQQLHLWIGRTIDSTAYSGWNGGQYCSSNFKCSGGGGTSITYNPYFDWIDNPSNNVLIAAKGGDGLVANNGNTIFTNKDSYISSGTRKGNYLVYSSNTYFLDKTEVKIMSITPLQDGKIEFVSLVTPYDPFIAVYDENTGQRLYYDSNNKYGTDFRLIANVKKGKKYLIKMGCNTPFGYKAYTEWIGYYPKSTCTFYDTSDTYYKGGGFNFISNNLKNTKITNYNNTGDGKVEITFLDYCDRKTFFFIKSYNKLQGNGYSNIDISNLNTIDQNIFNATANTADKKNILYKTTINNNNKLKLYVSSKDDKININSFPEIAIVKQKIKSNKIKNINEADITKIKIVDSANVNNRIKYYFEIKNENDNNTHFCYFQNNNIIKTNELNIENGNKAEELTNLSAKNLSALKLSSIKNIVAVYESREDTNGAEINKIELVVQEPIEVFTILNNTSCTIKNYFDRFDIKFDKDIKKVKIIFRD